MTLALAIADATGLVPGVDFRCQDDGAGVFLAEWLTDKMPPPTTKDLQDYLAAYQDPVKVDQRSKLDLLRQVSDEYLVAFIAFQELGDDSLLKAVREKITAKAVSPISAPSIDPVTP